MLEKTITSGNKVRANPQYPIVAGIDQNNVPQLLKTGPNGELKVGGALSIGNHDYKEIAYADSGKTNILTIKFRSGGVGGTIVNTLTFSYASDPTTTPNAAITGIALT